MGDPRRFHLFADFISKYLPKETHIADVASGKGYLKAALRQIGYRDVTCWDRRKKNGKLRQDYRYGYFLHNMPVSYQAVVAMHPDEATDHCILYAAKHRVPAIICPCCAKPSASQFVGSIGNHDRWIQYLVALARKGKLKVEEGELSMYGRNRVLVCYP